MERFCFFLLRFVWFSNLKFQNKLAYKAKVSVFFSKIIYKLENEVKVFSELFVNVFGDINYLVLWYKEYS